MLCQNCGKNEANIRYTQIINGVKKEIALCEDCGKKLGIDNIGIPDIAMNFHSLLGDFFNDYVENSFLPTFNNETIKCKKCGMTYDEFIEKGMFGCSECYDTFSSPIDSLLKNLHGTAKHVGRYPTLKNNKEIEDKINFIDDNKVGDKKESENGKKTDKRANKDNKKNSIKEELQKELEKAIKEERYEDAAKIRDQLKEMK